MDFNNEFSNFRVDSNVEKNFEDILFCWIYNLELSSII